MPSASVTGNASRKRSAGSRSWPGRRRPGSAAAIVSDGPSPSHPRLQSGAAAEAHRGDRLMAKVPGFAKAFAGRWRIVEMDNWDDDFLDLVEEAHLALRGAADGEIAPSRASWTCATAPATARPAPIFLGRVTTKTTPLAAADG